MYNGKIVVLNGNITKSLTFTSFLGILGAAFRYLEVWKRFIFEGSFRKDKILVRSRNQTGSELADFLRFERPLPLMGLSYIFPREMLETSEIAIRGGRPGGKKKRNFVCVFQASERSGTFNKGRIFLISVYVPQMT